MNGIKSYKCWASLKKYFENSLYLRTELLKLQNSGSNFHLFLTISAGFKRANVLGFNFSKKPASAIIARRELQKSHHHSHQSR